MLVISRKSLTAEENLFFFINRDFWRKIKYWPDGEARGQGKMSCQSYCKFITWRTWMFILSLMSAVQKFFHTFLSKPRVRTSQRHWRKVGIIWYLGTTNPCKNVCVNPSHRWKKNWSTTKVSGIYPLGSVPNFMAIHPDLVWTKLVDWPSDSLTLPKKLKKELKKKRDESHNQFIKQTLCPHYLQSGVFEKVWIQNTDTQNKECWWYYSVDKDKRARHSKAE